MPTEKLFFEEYWPVDIGRLRPKRSYDNMVNIRRERMAFFQDDDGIVKAELVEEVPCPICDSDAYDQTFVKEGFTFVQCKNCNLIYVNPCLKEEYVKQVYKHQSYSDIVKSLVGDSNDYRRERFGKERVGIINHFLPEQPGPTRRLLDVGCATGFFLEAARESGWDVYGVEPNPYMADFAQKNGLNVRNETIEETTLPDSFFDAVALFELIEHVKNPLQIIEKVYQLLRQGGMVFIYTPNFDCAERLIMGTDCHFIWGSNHLSYFTVDTLCYALERVGFAVEHYETQGLDMEDMIWYFEHTGKYDARFMKDFRHELQFLVNAGDWGKNLRMYARKP